MTTAAPQSVQKQADRLEGAPLSYVILYVKDAKKAARFYQETLGLPLRRPEHRDEDANDGWVEFELPGGTTLALHHGKSGSQEHRKSDGISLSFTVANLDATFQALKDKGVRFLDREPVEVCPGHRAAHFVDPDGNELSIFGK